MRQLIFLMLLFPAWAKAATVSVDNLIETDQGVYFSKMHDQSDQMAYLIMKPEITLAEIAQNDNDKTSTVRATLRLRKRSKKDINQLPGELNQRRFVSQSVRATSDCKFNSSQRSKLLSLSVASDIEGNRFTGEDSYVCSFTFSIKLNDDAPEIAAKIKEEAKNGTLINVNFENYTFKVFKKEATAFDVRSMARDILAVAPTIEQSPESSVYAAFLWASEMTNDPFNWPAWLGINSDERSLIALSLFSSLYTDKGSNMVVLKSRNHFAEHPTETFMQMVERGEVTYAP